VERRVFLKRGLLGGVLLAAGGGLTLGLSSTKMAYVPSRPLKVLDERHFAIVGAIASRTVAVENANLVEVAHGVDDVLSIAVPETQEDVKGLLMLFENALAGFVFDRRLKPFTRLAPEQQDSVLNAWRDSSITIRRGGYHVLRKLTLASYYSSSSTWAAVGYPGPPEIAS
jgi:hypothetical protein